MNSKQARKDKADRDAIIETLEKNLQTSAKSLVGNKKHQYDFDAETVIVFLRHYNLNKYAKTTGELKQISGKQELYEQLFNLYI